MMFVMKKGLSPQLHRNRPDVPQAARFGTEGKVHVFTVFCSGCPIAPGVQSVLAST